MKSVKVYNLDGKVVKEVELNPAVFGVSLSSNLIHQAVVAQMNNARQVIAHAKTRAEVRGGGKKPWKQKGTGRARHGSIRSPLWKGGGVTFGPSKFRNFTQKLNKKMKKKALFMALSNKVENESIKLLENFQLEVPKTKDVVNGLKNLELADKKVLVVLPAKDDVIRLASRNLPNVKLILADSLNVMDVLNYEFLLMPESSLNVIEKVYLK